MRQSILAITHFRMLKTERPRACLHATALLTSRAARIGLLSTITPRPCHLPQNSRLAGYSSLKSVYDGLFGFSGATLERFDAVLGRLLDALSDPKRRGRTVVIVLATYWVAWTVYAVVAKQSQDFHFDMGEMVAWSREVTFGTPKHPPLPAWLVAAWFWIFPLTAWSYDLFAVGTAVVSLGV